MQYSSETLNDIAASVADVTNDPNIAVIFVGSLSDDHSQLEFNALTSLDKGLTQAVLQNASDWYGELAKEEDSQIEEPELPE